MRVCFIFVYLGVVETGFPVSIFLSFISIRTPDFQLGT